MVAKQIYQNFNFKPAKIFTIRVLIAGAASYCALVVTKCFQELRKPRAEVVRAEGENLPLD
jgi:hypothetical protein